MSGQLSGLRILLVEDEFLVAALIQDHLEAAGAAVIGPIGSRAEAERVAKSEEFDVAVLDWNLHGEQSDPIARVLIGRDIPCVIATGYGAVQQEFGKLPLIAKPYEPDLLVQMLSEAAVRQSGP